MVRTQRRLVSGPQHPLFRKAWDAFAKSLGHWTNFLQIRDEYAFFHHHPNELAIAQRVATKARDAALASLERFHLVQQAQEWIRPLHDLLRRGDISALFDFYEAWLTAAGRTVRSAPPERQDTAGQIGAWLLWFASTTIDLDRLLKVGQGDDSRSTYFGLNPRHHGS